MIRFAQKFVRAQFIAPCPTARGVGEGAMNCARTKKGTALKWDWSIFAPIDIKSSKIG